MLRVALVSVCVCIRQYNVISEHGGVVVECRTPNREVLGSIPTGVLCP